MEPANILSERLETQERGIRELKFEKISGGGCPRTPLGAWALGARLGNRSVFILDPRLRSLIKVSPNRENLLECLLNVQLLFRPSYLLLMANNND